MRENSGQGDAENNLRDPTLKEHEEVGGRRVPQPVPGDKARIGDDGNGETVSPSDRERGETASDDAGLPVDVADGS